jgi:UDP-2,3-diacylglucosamine pyrophosphatase LpxH
MSTLLHNYLLFSDVHLGGDLVQHARPWTTTRLSDVLRLDRDLANMLDHYANRPEGGRPWKLVIAGDLVDFVGMSIGPGPDERLVRPLDHDELRHGLASSLHRSVHKMAAVARRHDLVFRHMAAFVAAGHSIVLVRGNHDVEFAFDAAREAFVQALLDRAELSPDAASGAREAFLSRIEFRHWFYYEEGLLYVEHGHQYDETCAYQHQLHPVSPDNPDQISLSFSDILLRYVVRPTRGLSSEGHENKSMFDYLKFGISMGMSGCALLFYRFLSAIARMFGAWRSHLSEAAQEVRAEHERRMTELATLLSMKRERLRELASLAALPVTGCHRKIVRSVFLDGIVALVGAFVVILAVGLSELVPLALLPAVSFALFIAIYLWMRRAKVLDPKQALRRAAASVAKLMPARFVVMGHTHEPRLEALEGGATYVNLGTWASDDLDQASREAPYSHLVIRRGEAGPEARLMRWDRQGLPVPLVLGRPSGTPSPAV